MIYVCENNRWASGNSAAATLSVEDVSVRSVSYNMPGVTVDGTDILAVYEAAQAAVQRARDGNGPTLLECKTFRWRTHSESRGNPADPRPAGEIELSQSHDPVAVFIDRLVEQGAATRDQLQQTDADIAAAVESAIEFAKASPLPNPEDALTEVFAP